MEIEFDPDKEAINLKKHEISLRRASDLVVEGYEFVSRKGETRLHVLGKIDSEFYSLAFVFARMRYVPSACVVPTKRRSSE